MTTDPTDDGFDDRIRAGVRALADEAPIAPDLTMTGAGPSEPVPAEVHQFGSPRLIVAAVAAVIALIAGLAFAVTRTESSNTAAVQSVSSTTGGTATPSTPPPAKDAPLYGTRWILDEATKDGKPLPFQAGARAPTVTFDDHFECPGGAGDCSPATGAAYFYTTGCNSGSGSIDVQGSTIRSTGNGAETLVGCSNEIRPFPFGEGQAGPSTFEITGDELALRSPTGQVLTYRAAADALPKVSGQVLVEDHEGEVSYRVSWRRASTGGYAMTFDRDAGGRIASNRLVAPAKDPQIRAEKAHVYGQDLLYGLVPAEATTLTYIPSKTDPVAIPILDDDIGPYRGFATMVPSGDQRWLIVAKDAAGKEISRQSTDFTGTTEDPFGPPEGTEVARGTHKLGQYRLAWDLASGDRRLTLDRARATSVLPPVSVSVDPTATNDVVADVGHLSLENIIFGLGPSTAERATVERPVGDEGPFALRLIPLPGTTAKAFVGVVPWTSDTFDVTLYDAGGTVVGRYHHAGR